MGISGKKRGRSLRRRPNDGGSQVHPNSYFEQLEPRIILGSCLALGGAEALLGQAHAAEKDPHLSAPPPPGFDQLNPQNNFSPATELPAMFSWRPSSWPFEDAGKNGLAPETRRPAEWLSPQAGGSDISDKLKLQSRTQAGRRFLPSPSLGRGGGDGGGGGGRLVHPALNPALKPVLDPDPAPSDPQIIIRPVEPVNPGPGGGEDIDPPVANTLVLGASGPSRIQVGQEYVLSLSASGPGAKTIRQWTIDWGDGTVEDLEGNPDQARHVYDQAGDYVIKTSATNAEKTWTGPSVPLSVQGNRPPVFVSEPSLEAGVGRPWHYQAVAVDPDGDEVGYALISGPKGLSIDTATGLLSWTPGADYVGRHQVIIAAYDEHGASTRQEFELNVAAELQNRPPEIVSTPGTTAPAGSEYVYQVQARDPDGDLLTYILEGGPAGMAMDAAGRITWTPGRDLIGQSLAVRVAVEDGYGGRAWQEFEVVVTDEVANKAPIFISDPNTSHYTAENNNKSTGDVSEDRLDLMTDIGEIINRLASLNLSTQGVMVDVFLLFDDTGSFAGTAPAVKAVFPEIIARLTAALPNINFGFGVGRFEDYGGNDLPFILNQPIVSTETEGFWNGINQALNRTAPGNGGDGPESLIEALYQLATGAGFDGNNNGTTTDSGAAGLASTQTDPNGSGDVPAFDSFIADVENGVLNPQGNIGGGGFRSGALPIIICATDIGFAYQPDGRMEITGANDVSIPSSYFTGYSFRASTPYGKGAAIQETIDALRDIGALVLGLGTNDTARYALEALSLLTGAVNGSSEIIDNYTSKPIDTGDPYYFNISGNAASLAGSLVAAISAAILNTSHDIEVIASKDGVPFANLTGVIKNVRPGDLASFDLSFLGDGFEHSFDIQFVKAGTGVILGSIPVAINVPYKYQAQAVDPDGDEITYSLSGDTYGAQIDSSTGLITWNPTGNGLYTFTVVATDSRGNSAEQIYDVQVGHRPQNAPAPVITGLENTQAEVGRDFSAQVLAEAPNGGALSYFLTGQVPEGLTINRKTGEITWTPAMGQEGLQEFTVRVVSSEGVSSEMTISLAVLEKQLARNSKPVFTSQPALRAIYDQQYSYTIQVRDAEGDPVTLRLLMAPDGMIMDAATGRLLWMPGEEDQGSHRIIIQADDGRGGLNMQTFELMVTGANLPPVFTSTPPVTALTGADYLYLAEAVDPDGDQVTYRLDSASLTLGATINAYTGLLTWSNPPEGRHSLTVIAADADGEETSQTFSLEVAVNLPPRFVSDPVTVALKGKPYAYQIVVEDPNGDSVTLSLDQASINRGMYIDSDGVLRWQSEVTGEYRVTLTVTDPGGLGMSQQFSIAVVETVPTNQSPVINSKPEIRAWANYAYTYQVVATDPDVGDKLTYQLSTDKPASGLSINANGYVNWPSPIAGEYLVTITVTDKLGAQAIQTFTLTVEAMHNRPPRITTTPGNYSYNIGDRFSYQLGYYDADISGYGDECRVSLDQASLDRGMTVTPINATTARIDWTPGQSGYFTTTVTVTDRAGDQAVQTFTLRVFDDSENINSNRPPQITSSPATIAYIDEAYTYKIVASDPDGDVLSLSLDDDSLARGLRINDGLITWTPEAGSEGEYVVTITARDPQGAQYVQSYVLAVAAARPAGNKGAYFTNADDIPRLGLNYQETRFTLAGLDPEGGEVFFSLVGTSNINGMQVVGNELIWTPTWGARSGTATFRIVDEHGEGETITLNFVVIASNYGTSYYTGLYEGESLNYEINYTPSYGTLTSLELRPAAQDQGMVLDGNVLKWTAGAPGSYTAEIIASRVYGNWTYYDTLRVYISVLEPVNQPPVITSSPATRAVGTETYQYQVEAYDPEGGPLTYALEASSPWFYNAAIDQNGLLSAYVNYYQSSSWITIRVTDDHGNSTRQVFYLTVEPPVTNRPPVITSLPPKHVLEVGEYWSYAFYTDDPDRIYNRSDTCAFSLNPEAVTAGFNLQSYPNGVSGTIVWTPSAASIGSHEVILTATDSQGASVSQTFMIHVVEKANRPVYFYSSPNPLVAVNEAYSYYISTLDADYDPITLTMDQASWDRGLVLSGTRLTWTPTELGDFTVTLTASDGRGSTAVQTFVIRVVERQAYGGNQPAVITSPPLAIGYVGGVYRYEIEASDPEGGPVTLSLDAKSLARGMYLDGHNLIWDHPTIPGAYMVAITVVDEFGAGQTQAFRLHILDNKRFNHAPVITSQPSPVAVVGREYTYQVTASDVDGDPLVYTLAQGPAGISIDPGSGLLRFIPSQTGVHLIEIMVTDGNHILTQSFYLLVTANIAPIITSTPRLWGYMGQEYVYQATALDPNGDGFTWRLEDGSPGMAIDEATGRFTFQPTGNGVFWATIAVRDEYGLESRQTFNFVIWDALINTPPRITSGMREIIPAGHSFTHQLTAEDPDHEEISFSLVSGPAGMNVSAAGLLVWTPSSDQVGIHKFTVRATDARGAYSEAEYSLSVVADYVNEAPAFTSSPPSLAVAGSEWVYQARALDPDGDSLYFMIDEGPTGLTVDPRSGLFRWKPNLAQLGEHEISVRVVDAYGAWSTQSFTVKVQAANTAPIIVSTPPTVGKVGSTWVYQAVAEDGEGDEMEFYLGPDCPPTMQLDPRTGLVAFTSAVEGEFVVELYVKDSRGAVSGQRFLLAIKPEARNLPPEISSTPGFYAAPGREYVYQVLARDPDGDALAYSLRSAPAGMRIDASGRLSWTPTESQTGEHRIEIAVSDGRDGMMQSYLLKVLKNSAPAFGKISDQTVIAGTEFVLEARATDPDKDALKYELIEAPEGMTVDANGRLRWNAPAIPAGGGGRTHQVVLRASDPFGEEARVAFTLTVTADTEPPEVHLSANKGPAAVNDPVSFLVRAHDAGGVAGMYLIVDGQKVAVNANGLATVVFDRPGQHTVQARAWDQAGNLGEASLSILIIDPADQRPPTVEWNIPGGLVVDDVREIRATVFDPDSETVDWVLSLRASGSETEHLLAQGSGRITNQLLETLDPTLWANGPYVLTLTAVDGSGHKTWISETVIIKSQYKLGNFNLSFQDLEVNVGGIPIIIQRSYDTFESGVSGDFGYGWSMTYIPVSLKDNTGYDLSRDPTAAYYSDAALYHGAKLTVRMPDGKSAVFTVQAEGVPFVNGMYKIKLVAESGVEASLAIEGNPILTMDAEGRFFVGGYTPFNPASEASPYNYVLTTADGAKYRINGRTGGCSRVDAPGGERIEVTASGIRSYDAKGALVNEVQFLRDEKGRITAIIDPKGDRKVTYEYSAAGDLIAVDNSRTGKVELTYLDDPEAPAHYLKSIIDHRGVTAIDVAYDYVTGRITGITGADGSSAGVGFVQKVGPGLNAELVTDALGRVTETVVDLDGNVIRTINHLPDPKDPTNRDKLSYFITVEEFDAKGNSLGKARPFTVTEEQLRALGKNQYDYRPDDLKWESRSTYDNKGNQLTYTDAYGQVTYYSYDKNGNVLKMVDPLGRVTENKYDSTGRPTQTINADGSISVYAYDGQDNIKSITTILPDGAERVQSAIEYSKDGKPTQMVDANGNVTRFGYDDQGRQIYTENVVKDPQNPGVTHTVINYQEYDDQGRVSSSWQEVDGVETSRTSSTYNEAGQVLTSTDHYGLVTQHVYDINGQNLETRRQVIDENGAKVWLVSRTVYDAAGQVIWSQQEHVEADPDNLPKAAQATYSVYDALGRVIRTELRKGVLISVSGEGLNLTTSVTNAGTLVSYSATGYDQAGRTAWEENAKGVKTVYFYTPEGAVSHTAIDLDGDLNTLDDQYATGQNIYDEYGRQIASILDRDGDLSTTGDQTVTRYVYDSQGRLVKTIYADGTFTALSYDDRGQKASETDQLGRTTYYEYDSEGRLTAVVLPQAKHPVSGELVHVRYEYAYDAGGNQISLKDNIFQTDPIDQTTIDRSGQRETTFEYNWRGQQISRTLPDGSTEYFSYDEQGRQQKHVSFEGRVTYYEYDDYGRTSRVIFYNGQADFNQGKAAKALSYTYDLWGRVIREVDTKNGTTLTSYDADGNVSRIESPQGIINYEYDPVTGQVSRTWTGRDSARPITDIRNSYDELGRLESVTTRAREGAALSTPETARYIYDLIGNLDKIIQANGLISDYEYDQLNRLKELTHYAPDDTPEDLSDNDILQRYTYDYYQDGNKSGETFIDKDGATHTWAWVYDQLGRLILEVHDNADDSLDYTTDYVYDLVGNRLVKRTDKGNDGTVDEEVRSAFDQNDRLKSETEIVGGVQAKRTDYVYNKTEQIAKTVIDLINSRTESKTTMEYDAQGRMSKITIETYTDGVLSQVVTQEYSYDSSGIKIRQVERVDANADGVVDAESITTYLNDFLNHTGYAQVLEERRVENGQEVKVTTYTIGHDVLAQFDSINGYLALLADGHGSTRAVADIRGKIVQQYNYDAYGNAHGFVAKDALTNLLYSGEQFNPVSGLQYLRARWYNPQNGRFNRLDPYSGNQQSPISFHKYAYAHMNPIMNTDPTGLMSLIQVMMVSGITSFLGGMGLKMTMNWIEGKPAFQGVLIFGLVSGLVGALMPLVAHVLPSLVTVLAAFGIPGSIGYAWGIQTNPDITPEKKAAAWALVFVSLLTFTKVNNTMGKKEIGGGLPDGVKNDADLNAQFVSTIKNSGFYEKLLGILNRVYRTNIGADDISKVKVYPKEGTPVVYGKDGDIWVGMNSGNRKRSLYHEFIHVFQLLANPNTSQGANLAGIANEFAACFFAGGLQTLGAIGTLPLVGYLGYHSASFWYNFARDFN